MTGVLVEGRADVVAVFLSLLAREGRGQSAAAVSAPDQPAEWMAVPLALLSALHRTVSGEHLLNLLPLRPGDDRLVLALVSRVVMRNVPGINRAGENPVDGRSVPRFRRMLLAGADRNPFAGFQSQPVDLRDRRLNGLQRHVFLEDQPDRFRLFLVDEQFLGERIGTVAPASGRLRRIFRAFCRPQWPSERGRLSDPVQTPRM